MLQRKPAPAVMRRVLLALLATAACLAQLARAQRGQVPSPPEECSDKIRKATKWGVATAAYQVRCCRLIDGVCLSNAAGGGTHLAHTQNAQRALACTHHAYTPNTTDRGRVERRRPHAERVGRVCAHAR